MMRNAIILASLVSLAGCGSPAPRQEDAAPAVAAEPMAQPSGPADTPALLPQPALDPAVLESRNCTDVAGFYAQAIQVRDFMSAEKVWNKDLLPADGLAKQFAAYRAPKLEMGERTEEGAAGSLYCEVAVTLLDGADP